MDRDSFNTTSMTPQFADVQIPVPPTKLKRQRRSVSAVEVKTFVLDTNVLLHDPACLHRFDDNHVCIPVDVLSELDRFKTEPTERGANARDVHRTLTSFFSNSSADITKGVPTPGGGTVRLVIYDPEEDKSPELEKFQRVFPGLEKMDHRILACTLWLREKTRGPVILVSKDLNMSLKARAVGIDCQDYLNDKVEVREVSNFELACIQVTPQELQVFATTGGIDFSDGRLEGIAINEYVLLTAGDKHRLPGRRQAGAGLVRLRVPESLQINHGRSIKSMNLGQACLLDALMNPEISLVTAYGQAGTGKTLLSVAAGLSQVMSHDYNGLTISRPIIAMGNGIGFLPGSLEDKMRPWLQPIYDALDLLMRPTPNSQTPVRRKNKHQDAAAPLAPNGQPSTPYEHLVRDGTLEIEALCYIRGRSIPDRFFILDEAQQLTPLEAKTVVTRMSRGSKLVLIGDPAQIDNPYVDSRSNGLVYTRLKMRGQPFAAHVPLVKGERSAMAEAGAKLM